MPGNFDTSSFTKFLGEKREAVIRATVEALDIAGEQVIGDAQQLAPVGGPPYSKNDPAPGTLQSSGVTLPAVVDEAGGTVKKIIGFNTAYAAVQHENLTFRHSHGQAKYLEIPLRHDNEKVMKFVSDRIKQALKEK